MNLTCDFCGNSSAHVTRISSPPMNFSHFNFCDINNNYCYENYSKYVDFGDESNGIPFSVSLDRQEISCDWCGKQSNSIVRQNDLRDPTSKFRKYREMHSNFCSDGDCAHNYSKFIYARDLSKGLPYSVRNIIAHCTSAHKQCGYCGKKNAHVITNPWTEENLKCKTFCKNKTCYENFYNYVSNNKKRVPFAILTKAEKSKLPLQKEPLQKKKVESVKKRFTKRKASKK
jgi:hypothetical protein